MDSGQLYRQQVLATVYQEPNAQWRLLDKRDSTRIQCDRNHMCGEQAVWGLNSNHAPFSYVCDYHRFILETTGTFWDDKREETN